MAKNKEVVPGKEAFNYAEAEKAVKLKVSESLFSSDNISKLKKVFDYLQNKNKLKALLGVGNYEKVRKDCNAIVKKWSTENSKLVDTDSIVGKAKANNVELAMACSLVSTIGRYLNNKVGKTAAKNNDRKALLMQLSENLNQRIKNIVGFFEQNKKDIRESEKQLQTKEAELQKQQNQLKKKISGYSKEVQKIEQKEAAGKPVNPAEQKQAEEKFDKLQDKQEELKESSEQVSNDRQEVSEQADGLNKEIAQANATLGEANKVDPQVPKKAAQPVQVAPPPPSLQAAEVPGGTLPPPPSLVSGFDPSKAPPPKPPKPATPSQKESTGAGSLQEQLANAKSKLGNKSNNSESESESSVSDALLVSIEKVLFEALDESRLTPMLKNKLKTFKKEYYDKLAYEKKKEWVRKNVCDKVDLKYLKIHLDKKDEFKKKIGEGMAGNSDLQIKWRMNIPR